ncbi:hypothetical protein HELRODRAFT_172053 [Helobdella robusta]|uniref:Dynactin subunit 4 n=1 Tax=Helobdella robusta TaxID=6412 RepID=T1F4Z3_HELRO|nr:hypothetical protein HELRODRAFT_172053 [Helobdella robusta]ESO05040.1 hypothetical protein HELRODRAFT_172053 [Helobdella robusta]
MATFMNTDCVKYVSKGVVAPLCELSFCRHCLELRSKFCVFHEVDSLFCPNCLESMPAAEAKTKKNRCGSCFDCPTCNHALSTRATSIMSDEACEDGSKTLKKAFYLACGFCRWSSRDVGIKDQSVASGGWTEQINPYAERIASLVEYYKQYTLKELQEKEKKRFRRKSFFQLPEKFGLGHLTVKRRPGLSLNLIRFIEIKFEFSSKDQAEINLPEIELSRTFDSFDELPDDVYTKPLDLSQVTNINQRLSNPEFQPATVQNLYPNHKHLLIKRSQRCKQCDHNLSKPEYNPSAIKFKIQLVALHHIPEIRIMKPPVLRNNQTTQAVLTLTNPLEITVQVQLSAFNEDSTDEADATNGFNTAKIELPSDELLVAKSEDAADVEETQTFNDDPKIIAFRKGCKIGFFVSVTPKVEQGDAKVRLKMRHNYLKRQLSMAEKDVKDNEIKWMEHEVQINFGAVVNE